jgi:2-oxoisovalerate dehydrogenase E2 component (dihydrolipoyl transacylase)
MSVHVTKVPDLGEGIAEVELVGWHVKAGDAVAEDQVLAEVMTDKATVEIPSPVAGRVLGLGGEVGDMLAVGSELIRIELDTPAATAASESPPATKPLATAPASPAAAAPSAAPAPRASASAASAPAGARAPGSTPAAPRAGATTPTSRRGAIASPAVRARAWELGIDLQAVTPSGAGDRVMQADLDAYVARHPDRPPSAPPGRPGAPAASQTSTATHTEKIVGLRRKIAQKMQESKRRIPHYAYVEEVDVGELEALRERLNAKWGEARGRLTVLPFLIRAVVLAVHDFPQVNATFDDEAGIVTRYDAVHAGIATQTGNGLMVPVLRNAQAHDLWSTASEIARLSEAARTGRIVRDELLGSTLTITSLGKLGGIVTTPVINHPEVAIVGVNKIAERAVVRGGSVVVRPIMNLSSSFDHRVVDGADAAAFIQSVRERIEHPAMLFVE